MNFKAFNEAVVRAYEKSLITIAQLAMALSVSHTGRRSNPDLRSCAWLIFSAEKMKR